MTPTAAQAKTIETTLTELNAFLDSDEFMILVNGLDTPPPVRKQLAAMWERRSELTTGLLRLYAKDISSNDAKVRKLIKGFQSLQDEVDAAAEHLGTIANRIKKAVAVAKGVDRAIQVLVAMGVLAL